MKRIVLTCETVTPMFMYGADGKTPELRPSEFKGMMRFWWRAARAETDIAKLKVNEAKLFGGTGSGEGKSKVKLQVLYNLPPNMIGRNLKDDYGLVWDFDHDSRSLKGDHAGIAYLLYSTILPGKEKAYMKPGFVFNIVISSIDELAYKHALSALWLAICFGGFGTRSRRGGGNVVVTKVSGDSYGINFIPNGNDKKSLGDWINANLFVLGSIHVARSTKETVQYSTLPNTIIPLNPKKNWIDALNSIGTEFSNFRLINRANIFEMGAFGMPIIHRGSGVKMVPYSTHGKLSDRFSSPIIFKVIKSQNLFFPLVFKLNVNMNKIGKEEGSNVCDAKIADMSKVNEFLELVKKMK